MRKIYKFIGSIALMVTLSSCDNYSGSFFGAFDDMEDSDEIGIMYNYPSSVCDSQELLDSYKYDYPNSDIRISVESNSVTCETYGKSDNGYDCSTYYAGYNSNNSCVIGLRYNNYSKPSNENSMLRKMVDKALIIE